MNGGRDPRSVANFILDVAERAGHVVTNLVLNKVAYFLHGAYLARFDQPLIDARIEAWDYGPVIREIYYEFKSFKDKPIDGRASQIDLQTGTKRTSTYDFCQGEEAFLIDIALSYLRLRPGALVNLSHVHDGPWHEVWFHDGNVNPGMCISNDLIKKHFATKERH